MRSTSSAYRALAVLLSTILAVSGGMVPCAWADRQPEPCLLLKITSRGIPLSTAREAMAPLAGLLKERLEVRWVMQASAAGTSGAVTEEAPFPEPDSVELGGITRRLEAASRRMDVMDTVEAARLLDEAETRSRRLRFGEVIRPYLAEIFFRQGILFLWNGEEDRCIERFTRSRSLRPGFSPEPALYSPSVRGAWERSRDRPAAAAEVLVQSIPPGAGILLEGEPVGVTPGRIRISRGGPVRIRVEREGFRAGEKITQWLPGDSGMVEFSLERDPDSELLSLLAADPEGVQTGRALAAMGSRAGASRVAVLVYDAPPGETPVLRVFSLNPGSTRAEWLGSMDWPGGTHPETRIAARTAEILAKAGWPAKTDLRKPKRSWYDKWWFWTVIVAVVAGVAAAGSGGGGSGSGGSTGSIGVAF